LFAPPTSHQPIAPKNPGQTPFHQTVQLPSAIAILVACLPAFFICWL